ncbi:MAG: hypothetical protein FD160_3766 [Caulobacteraceae bacterium]|nr:MAG: hypothetical protein FD160_3766 [Caulobacteraceae bacterium]
MDLSPSVRRQRRESDPISCEDLSQDHTQYCAPRVRAEAHRRDAIILGLMLTGAVLVVCLTGEASW